MHGIEEFYFTFKCLFNGRQAHGVLSSKSTYYNRPISSIQNNSDLSPENIYCRIKPDL